MPGHARLASTMPAVQQLLPGRRISADLMWSFLLVQHVLAATVFESREHVLAPRSRSHQDCQNTPAWSSCCTGGVVLGGPVWRSAPVQCMLRLLQAHCKTAYAPVNYQPRVSELNISPLEKHTSIRRSNPVSVMVCPCNGTICKDPDTACLPGCRPWHTCAPKGGLLQGHREAAAQQKPEA